MNEQILIGLALALPSFLLGLLGYMRSRRVDIKVDERAAKTQDIQRIDQVIDGQKEFISLLQKENESQRKDLHQIRDSLITVRDRMEVCMDERTNLRINVDDLKEKIARSDAQYEAIKIQLNHVQDFYKGKEMA